MKKEITRLIFFILTISTFVTIFIFSNQNGEESGETSRGFTKMIIDVLPITKNLEEERKVELIEKTQTCIRKLAHFSIYTVAGINLMGFINTYERLNQKNKIALVLLIGIAYAISDEFHQMFTGGRTPAIGDVFIDSMGILFGLTIFVKVDKIRKGKRNMSFIQ